MDADILPVIGSLINRGVAPECDSVGGCPLSSRQAHKNGKPRSEFYLRRKRPTPIRKTDFFIKRAFTTTTYMQGMEPANEGWRPKSAAGGQRRKRTHFSAADLAILVESFERNPRPLFQERERLAGETGKDESRIQVWFQNRRARRPKTTSSRAHGNQHVLPPDCFIQEHPVGSQHYLEEAPASENSVHPPSQPGASWHSSHHAGVNTHFQWPNSSFGIGQPDPFPQSDFQFGSVAGPMQSNFGGPGPLPYQDQESNGYGESLPQNYGSFLLPWQQTLQNPADGFQQQMTQYNLPWADMANN